MTKYDWLLFFHVTGAFLLIGGGVVAGALTIMSRRRERPSEIAAFLGLVRLAVPLIFTGSLLTLAFGLWLVHAAGQGYSFGDAWVVSALVLWVVASALGGRGGRMEEETRKLAERTAADGDVQTPELRSRLRDPLSYLLNFGSGLAILAVLALMIWKPGA